MKFRIPEIDLADIDTARREKVNGSKVTKPSQAMNDTQVMSAEDLAEDPDPTPLFTMVSALHAQVDTRVSDINERQAAHAAVDRIARENVGKIAQWYSSITGKAVSDREPFVRASDVDSDDFDYAGLSRAGETSTNETSINEENPLSVDTELVEGALEELVSVNMEPEDAE